LQRDLGDGYSVDVEGQFVAIRGISMSSVWLYYSSPAHPETCTLAQTGLGPGVNLAPVSRRRAMGARPG
jgi:hypothetical protein